MAKQVQNKKKKNHAAVDKESKASHQPDWIVLVLAGAGMLLTAYLTGVAWLEAAPAFCGEGSNCATVQQSRWSRVLGLPLALWGFLTYAVLAFIAYRPASRLKRWKRMWTVAFLAMIISLYLTQVAAVELGVACLWCLFSLALLTAIFVAVALRRPPSAPEMPWWNWWLNSVVAGIVVVVLLHLYYNSDILKRPPDPRLQALVQHLDETGAIYYGASWCVSCQQQRQQFGALADELPYVECSPYGRGGIVASACTTQGIQNYPTWIINGRRFEGVLKPAQLAEYSGFDWKAADSQ